MKKIIALTLTIIILSAALSSCSGKAPEINEIYDRVVSLIEASYEINDIFFGEGLPTYPRVTSLTDQTLTYSEKYGVYYLIFEDEEVGQLCMYYDNDTNEYKFARVVEAADVSEADGTSILYDEESGLYFFATEYEEHKPEYVYNDEDDAQDYCVVRTSAEYLSIEEIKSAAAKVYSADYLEDIYQAAFDGISTGSGAGVIGARFIEQGYLLRQYEDIEPLITEKRIYDYSTMQIVRPSNGKYVNLTIDSHLEGSDEILNIKLTLVFENGAWYLNSPTY